MIPIINFPEGTKIKLYRSSYTDQFDKNDPLLDGCGYAYFASQIYSARDINMNYQSCFENSKCVHRIKNANPSTMYKCFASSNCFYDILIDKTNFVNFDDVLYSTFMKNFLYISGKASSINNAFYSTTVKYLNFDVDTSEVYSMTNVFSTSLVALYGKFSIKNISYFSNYTLTGFSNAKIRQITIADIGYSQTSVSFTYWPQWGHNTSYIPDARKSLIDSLITYSFDRAAAGYSNCTISLHSKTKALLTEEEIAQITAKGFTIA